MMGIVTPDGTNISNNSFWNAWKHHLNAHMLHLLSEYLKQNKVRTGLTQCEGDALKHLSLRGGAEVI